MVYGDIGSNKDVDVYSVRPPSNYNGPVTFQLQSAGISLLTTKLTVVDSKGNVLGQAQAASDFGDTVTVHLNQVEPEHDLLSRGRGGDPGRLRDRQLRPGGHLRRDEHGLALGPGIRPDRPLSGPRPQRHQRDLPEPGRGPVQQPKRDGGGGGGGGGCGSLDTQLTPLPGYAQNTHYETTASLASSSEVDYLPHREPSGSNGQDLVLTATVRAVAPNGVAPRVTILDSDQNVVNGPDPGQRRWRLHRSRRPT